MRTRTSLPRHSRGPVRSWKILAGRPNHAISRAPRPQWPQNPRCTCGHGADAKQFSRVCRIAISIDFTRKAGLAQLVEHVICNHGVTGSNPVAGTNENSSLERRCPASGQLTHAFFFGDSSDTSQVRELFPRGGGRTCEEFRQPSGLLLPVHLLRWLPSARTSMRAICLKSSGCGGLSSSQSA